MPLRLTDDHLQQALAREENPAALAILLEEVQPYDLAVALHHLPEEHSLRVLTALEPAVAAETLEHLEYAEQYRFLHHMEETAARRILEEMSSDDVADLVGALHPRQEQEMLKLLPRELADTIRNLAEYPEHTAGGRMTVDYVQVRQQMTAEQILAHLRKVGREADTIQYIYVVDSAGRLTGVCSLLEVIVADPGENVSEFMNHSPISVPAAMDQEEVAEIVSNYDFNAVPVVSPDNRMLGIVTVDDVIDVLQEEATEDVLRMGATDVPDDVDEKTFLQSVWALAKPRLPWLISLLFLEMGSSFIVGWFSDLVTPTVATMLALFTVVMSGETGNAATQSLAVVVRGLATGEIEQKDMPRIVLREMLVGVVVGVIVGLTLMLTGWVWQHDLRFGFAVGLALAVNLVVAKTLGGLFPVVIQRIGIDPAVASGPFITTLTDNTSVFVYYGIAAVVLRNLG